MHLRFVSLLFGFTVALCLIYSCQKKDRNHKSYNLKNVVSKDLIYAQKHLGPSNHIDTFVRQSEDSSFVYIEYSYKNKYKDRLRIRYDTVSKEIKYFTVSFGSGLNSKEEVCKVLNLKYLTKDYIINYSYNYPYADNFTFIVIYPLK